MNVSLEEENYPRHIEIMCSKQDSNRSRVFFSSSSFSFQTPRACGLNYLAVLSLSWSEGTMWGCKGGTRKISVWRNKNASSLDDQVKEKQRLASTQTGMLEFGAGAGQRRRKRSSFSSGTENCIMPPALRAWPFSPRAALSCVSRSMNNVQLLSLPRVPGKHPEIHSTWPCCPDKGIVSVITRLLETISRATSEARLCWPWHDGVCSVLLGRGVYGSYGGNLQGRDNEIWRWC